MRCVVFYWDAMIFCNNFARWLQTCLFTNSQKLSARRRIVALKWFSSEHFETVTTGEYGDLDVMECRTKYGQDIPIYNANEMCKIRSGQRCRVRLEYMGPRFLRCSLGVCHSSPHFDKPAFSRIPKNCEPEIVVEMFEEFVKRQVCQNWGGVAHAWCSSYWNKWRAVGVCVEPNGPEKAGSKLHRKCSNQTFECKTESEMRVMNHDATRKWLFEPIECVEPREREALDPRARNPRFYFVHAGTKPRFMTKKGHQKSGIPCSAWSAQCHC
jgi:hypothetical protein